MPLMLLMEEIKEDVSIFSYNYDLRKNWEKKLKDLFVFSDAAQTRLYAFRAFKTGAAREREILCALFAHRSLAFRAFHGGCSCATKITECHDTIK
jgi:hypothetical protein